jgi:hypothetical protein
VAPCYGLGSLPPFLLELQWVYDAEIWRREKQSESLVFVLIEIKCFVGFKKSISVLLHSL